MYMDQQVIILPLLIILAQQYLLSLLYILAQQYLLPLLYILAQPYKVPLRYILAQPYILLEVLLGVLLIVLLVLNWKCGPGAWPGSVAPNVPWGLVPIFPADHGDVSEEGFGMEEVFFGGFVGDEHQLQSRGLLKSLSQNRVDAFLIPGPGAACDEQGPLSESLWPLRRTELLPAFDHAVETGISHH